ncbi:OmpA-OmpF porin, OOP family [Vibrio xiamenensis]|uniref:OmpA-OmpF porin, OOP family n=1 Tax=Vibrio xiamenensis TaxID=861298 RepID=A0A1G7W9N5_9VIBR|nr:OmpA family protein [Vibrio xiamenensis]SDG68641.1 OmpA-OmpF porin, OOP family [Vibrio xiamenensis]
MKKLAAVISASLLMAASTSAMAEVYVGAKAGKSWLDDACTSATVNCDKDDSTVGAFIGYEMWDFLSIEAGYDYLGKFDGQGLNNDKVEAYTLAPKVNLPITEDISLYGKFGGAFVNYGDEDDYSYLGAAGIEFDSHEHVAVRVEYQAITDINNDQVRAMGNSATIGVVYKFGETAEPAPVVVEEEPVVVEEPAEPEVITKTFETQRLGTGSFELNSAELKADSLEQLDELVDFLNTYPQANVQVIGYTDASGTEAYNQVMSEKRADAVANALVAKGIDASRITTAGEGEKNPIASNATHEGRVENRRVEIIVPEFDYQVQQ